MVINTNAKNVEIIDMVSDYGNSTKLKTIWRSCVIRCQGVYSSSYKRTSIIAWKYDGTNVVLVGNGSNSYSNSNIVLRFDRKTKTLCVNETDNITNVKCISIKLLEIGSQSYWGGALC